jgi:hypothetical protein
MTMSDELIDQGYAVLKNVFSGSEILEMRRACERKLGPSEFACDNADFRIDMCNRDDDFRWVAFHTIFLDALRETMQVKKLAFVPEHSIMRNYYRLGFHRDSQTFREQLKDEHMRLAEDGWLLCRPVIHLQPNSTIRGGGLDVIPRTHKSGSFDVLPETVFHEIGDVVLFHLDLRHQGTPGFAWDQNEVCRINNKYPRTYAALQPGEIPPPHKLGLYLLVAPDNDDARTFARFLRHGDQTHYTDCLRPYKIHPETVRLSQQHDVAWLTGDE